MGKILLLSAASALPLLLAEPASAAVHTRFLVEPADARVLAGGPGFGAIENTFNQAGLSANYVSGVTPTMPYLATTTHNPCCAWFSEFGSTTATVSYLVLLRGVKWIDGFHLWNEENSGIGKFDLWWGSRPGDLAHLLLAGASPTDNPSGPEYLADSWRIAPKPAGFYTLIMSECPQPDPGSRAACAIAEVAFSGPVNGPDVPEPGTWAMMIAGFGLVGWAARNRRRDLVRA